MSTTIVIGGKNIKSTNTGSGESISFRKIWNPN